MILVYIKLAFRLLIRNSFFSLVNVVGLSIGFAAFFSLWQYATSELMTDQHHKDYERIFRVGMHQTWDEPGNTGNLTFGPSRASLPPRFKSDFPEVESYVRVLEQGGFFQEDLIDAHGTRMVVSHRKQNGEEQIFRETKASYADRNFFEFFGISMIHGEASTALAGVNFVAVSRTLSEKYFGNENPLGEILLLNDSIAMKVSGVFEDFPHNSKLSYDMVISNERLLTKWSDVYWGGTQNFIKLKRGTSGPDFEKKLHDQKLRYWGDELRKCTCDRELFVQPLADITFGNRYIGDEGAYKSKITLITLQFVSVIVLLMAWINYVNLSIAALTNRIKEFGARRVNGATAMDLVKQFVIESTMINLIAVGLALTILQMIRQPLEGLFEIYIVELWSTKPEVWLALLITIVCGIAITGAYPAYVCIVRQPRSLLTTKYSGSKSFVKSALTTLQFTIALALISWVFVVYLQLNYVLKKDVGLDQQGVIIVEGPVVRPRNYDQTFETFVRELSRLQGIVGATSSCYMVGDATDKPGDVKIVGSTARTGSDANGVRENFIPFFGLKILAGRNFVADDRHDAVIVSRITAERLGFKDPGDAIGRRVLVNTGRWHNQQYGELVGVVEDYNIVPYFNYGGSNTVVTSEGGFGIFLTHNNALFPDLSQQNVAVKVDLANVDRVMTEVVKLFDRTFPGNTFEWRFLDEQIAGVYGKEKVARNQILMFTIQAIGIACMGLVAMMTHRIFEMTKEVGIRKVLGASVFEIVRVLVQSTGAQFVIAAMFAIPLSWYLGNQYLQKYSERIQLSWWHYVVPIGILLVIMCSTIANMLHKTLRSNPVDSLKHE
ncbi:ABC transporter permease [Chryseolinea sp. T2]|uniref:ABC transporter permease n=1 Tax=Chryseolinea sp. T2 TaxID=3129255 RepID=UPI003077607B